MGLDMYAYTIDARLVDDDWVTDFPIHKRARRMVGFIDLPEDEVREMNDEDRDVYHRKQMEATQKAKNEGILNTEFAYWRKFNNLHAWMHRLYEQKGGTDPSFNCNNVRITAKDLDRLESEAATLKPAGGFFWGVLEDMTADSIADIKDFVSRSREAIASGKAVFYDSWW